MSPKRLSTRQGYSQNTHKCIPGEQVVTSKIRNTTTTNTVVRYKCTFLKIGCYFRRRFARVRSASLMVEILLLGFFHVLFPNTFDGLAVVFYRWLGATM